MTIKARWISLACVCVPLAAAADGPPKQVAELDRLVGAWKGTGKVTMGKDVAKLDAKLDCTKTSGGVGVSCAFRVTGIPGLPVYEETDLFGFEPNSGTFHWFAVTNAGETHDHVAKAFGAKIDWTYEGTLEGKAMREALVMTFGKDNRTVAVKADTIVGGATVATFEAELRR